MKKYFCCNKKPGNHLTKQGGFQAFFWPSLKEDRTFSGWYCKKYYYHSMKLHGPIELTNASKWVSILLFDVLTVLFTVLL